VLVLGLNESVVGLLSYALCSCFWSVLTCRNFYCIIDMYFPDRGSNLFQSTQESSAVGPEVPRSARMKHTPGHKQVPPHPSSHSLSYWTLWNNDNSVTFLGHQNFYPAVHSCLWLCSWTFLVHSLIKYNDC